MPGLRRNPNGAFNREYDLDVLIAESDPDDVALITDSLAETTITHTAHVVTTGSEALEFVRQRGEYANAPRPAIILLALDISEPNGVEVLSELKTRSTLRKIPVIVMTGSDDDEADVARSYELYANAHVRKPDETDEFAESIQSFANFWLTTARLPPTE